MTDRDRPTWGRRIRRTLLRAGCLATLFAACWTYQAFFTPAQRAARQHLAEADTRSAEAIDARLKPVRELFARGRKGADGFAAEALSWQGKWQFVRGLTDGGATHRAFLAKAFAWHVFNAEELEEALTAAVRGYLDDLDGYEAEMLVRLRADLADPGRPADLLPPALRGDEAFRAAYRKLAEEIAADLRKDIAVTAGSEVALFVASDIAAQVALQAARAAATQLGLDAGLLGGGAVSGLATLGVGMVVALILDAVLDQVLKLAGHDPEAEVAAKVRRTLSDLEAALVREDGGFLSRTKAGTLRQRLEGLHADRSKLRRATVTGLITYPEGGAK
jgi:hypothetical protein